MDRLKDLEPGTIVSVQVTVMKQQNGQTLCHIAGVGETGCWSLPGSMLGIVMAYPERLEQ